MMMNKRFRILLNVVERYSRSINFLVSTNFCHIEVVESRLVWISKLDFEASEAEVDNYAKILLESPKNLNIEGTSDSLTGTRKKRKSVVKQEVAKGSELEHDHERIDIQRALEELQKVIPVLILIHLFMLWRTSWQDSLFEGPHLWT